MFQVITSPGFILAIASLLSSQISAELLGCGPPKSFEVELENHQKAYVYDADIEVKYNRNELAVYEYPGFNEVNILLNDTVVTFTGHIVQDNEELELNATKISRIFNSKIAGSAQLLKNEFNESTLSDCKLYFGRNRNEEEINIPKKIQVEIFHEAVSCVMSTFCQKLGLVRAADTRRAENHPFNFGSLSVLFRHRSVNENHVKAPNSYNYDAKPTLDIDEIRTVLSAYNATNPNSIERSRLQSTINMLVDLAIAEVVKKMREENGGKIMIPDLHQNFSTGSSWWQTTGGFDAFSGTFEDLTTLSRTQDAVLSHKGLKFIASCGFGLSKARMAYDKYQLRYGIIKVNGVLSANIDGAALGAVVSVDYTRKPCRTVLQDLQVTEFGRMKVKMTGLGPLNKLLSKLITWITKKWQNEIVVHIREKLEEAIQQNLDKFNCERFRP